MKKLLSIATIISMLTSTIFELYHWPYGTTMFLISFGLLLPIVLILHLLEDYKNGSSKLITTLMFIGQLFLSQGLFFKIMHWPGANDMLIISLSLILPAAFVVNGFKQRKQTNGLSFLSFSFFFFSYVFLFRIFHWPGANELGLIGLGFILLTFIYLSIKGSQINESLTNILSLRSIVIASAALSFFLLFESKKIHVRVLDSEIALQNHLQKQIDNDLVTFPSLSETDPYISNVNQKTQNFLDFTDNIKKELVFETNGKEFYERVTEEKSVNSETLSVTELNLSELNNKTDIEFTSFLLIGPDITNVNSRKGQRLWHEIIATQEGYIAIVEAALKKNPSEKLENTLKYLESNLKFWKDSEWGNYYDIKNVHWSNRTFINATVSQALVRLTQIQAEIVKLRTMVLMSL
jgi:hypothetical protein